MPQAPKPPSPQAMRPRHTLIEQFSAFAQFEADQFCTWLIDAHLRRSMEQQQQTIYQPPSDEEFWAMYWYRTWEQGATRPARDHLVAYGQELIYWVALKTHCRLNQEPYGVADLFQMAIARFDRILQGFNPQQGTHFRGYATVMTANLLRESLRQQQAIDICTDWGLLRKISQKRLAAALAVAGLAPAAIERYVLAWRGFTLLYTPNQKDGSRRLSQPDEVTWQAIAEQYNRDRSHHLSTTAPAVTATELATWLSICARSARQYLYPSTVSIDATSPADTGSYGDSLTDDDQEEGLAHLVQLEDLHQRQTQRQQMQAVLHTTLHQLIPEAQHLLRLYYQQALTQQAIAQELNIKQYAVSRRLTRLREQLLHPLLEWAQATPHSSPSLDVIKNTSVALDDWLVHYYQQAPDAKAATAASAEAQP